MWLDLSRDFLGGIQNNLKFLGSVDYVVRVISCNPFWKFLRLGNSARDFWGG